jgi:hypothetical protein
MKHWTPLSLLLIALTMGVWSNADANSLLLADRPGDVYLFTPDNTTTLSLIARAKDFPIARYGVAEGKDSIYNLTYEPFPNQVTHNLYLDTRAHPEYGYAHSPHHPRHGRAVLGVRSLLWRRYQRFWDAIYGTQNPVRNRRRGEISCVSPDFLIFL